MDALLLKPRKLIVENDVEEKAELKKLTANNNACSCIERKIILFLMKGRLFFVCCFMLKNPVLIWATYKRMIHLRKDVWGGDLKKVYRINGKYYFTMYTPGWPSRAYDAVWKSEFRRHAPGN